MHPVLASAKRIGNADNLWRMDSPADRLKRAREAAGYASASSAAEAIGVAPATYAQHENGTRGFPATKADRYARFFRTSPEWLIYGRGAAPGDRAGSREPHIGNTPDHPEVDPAQAYVSVEILPTFAGMGGGGTGDGDRETALISRRLVEDELRAHPADLLVINVRGNSMEPMFHHGDQLIIDRRDKSPTQPGPFALLYEDGYVVKNVAWVERRTKLRVSSSNPEFGPEDFDPNEVHIMGRPVWFARRL